MRFIFLCCSSFLVAFSMLSCSNEPAQRNSDASSVVNGQAPAAVRQDRGTETASNISVVPENPDRRSTLVLSAADVDLSNAQVQWLVNGSPVTTDNTENCNCSPYSRGMDIEAVVRIGSRELRSNKVTIGNTPPEITSVRLLPEVFKPGDRFSISATASDLDDDTVTFRYAWTKNGIPAGTDAAINTPVRRGDTLQVTVTPFDGFIAGTPATVQREIENLPPSFVEHNRFSFSGDRYVYQAQATDPDGDSLTYSLDAPVDGVVMNATTGQVVWTVPRDFSGEQPVTLVADDGHGGTAKYTVTFSVR